MSRPRAADAEVTVVSRIAATDTVTMLELASLYGAALPAWEPGAHIDVLMPSGLVRQYSLCGDPTAATWRIAVLREETSRGGSEWICSSVEEGAALRLAGPRNHFSFAPTTGAPVLFFAAGIGVTPIAPMAAAAAAAGLDYRVHYSGRARERMALLDELECLHGERLVAHVSGEGSRVDLAAVLGSASAGTVVYACGPGEYLEAVSAAAEGAGLELHLEHFEAVEAVAPVWEGAFEVELALTGVTVEVPPERSILEVAEENGAFVLSSCTEGTCGTCETPVVEGEVDHRDSILTPQERARGDVMYVCVSRAACPKLVLEL